MSNIHQINVADEAAYLELYQYDNGQVLEFVTTSVADGTNVLFGGPKTRKAFRRIVENNQVAIPNKLLRETGKIQVTVETLTEDTETTIYDIAGYVKRRQEGGFDVEPEDEPTIIEVIFNKLKELAESVADLFRTKADKADTYTKDETDSKDSATLDSAKSYTDTIALGLGNDLVIDLNTSTYVLTLTLKHGNQTLATRSVDLPLESTVVSGRYDKSSKKLILTLVSGEVIEIPLGDLIDGLVSTDDLALALADYQLKITSQNKLDADLLDDSESTNKLTNETEKAYWNSRNKSFQAVLVNNQVSFNKSDYPGIKTGDVIYLNDEKKKEWRVVYDGVSPLPVMDIDKIDFISGEPPTTVTAGQRQYVVDMLYLSDNGNIYRCLTKTSSQTTTGYDYTWQTFDGHDTKYSASTGLSLSNGAFSVDNPLPSSAQADSGKFLVVDSNGNPIWKTIPRAEDNSFQQRVFTTLSLVIELTKTLAQ